MWIGIVVLCTFVAAALAALGLAVQAAVQRRWHVAVALLIPALGLGGPIAFMAGPAAAIWLFGNPDLRELPQDATRLDAAALAQLVTDQSVVGMYYDKDQWKHFQEQYRADGSLSGSGGPDNNPTQESWTGSWKLDGDTMCWKYDVDFSCRAVYADGDRYDAVNDRNEIDSWFQPAPGSG